MPHTDTPADLDTLNAAVLDLRMRAGWNKKEASLWAEPKVSFKAQHWRWTDARPKLDAAGELISTELAERRNLFLVNPIEGNHYATLRTMVCAYQMIKPAERARSHRHAPHALRLVLEADDDVYTVVDGARIDMRPNDVVLTPGTCWHGHANDGPADAYWIDYLDVPLVHLLEPMFLDHWPAGFQPPEGNPAPQGLVFPWASVHAQLRAQLAGSEAASVARLVLDAPVMPTTELAMTLIPQGARTVVEQATDNQIVTVVQGRGCTHVGGQRFEWARGDVMALPGWLARSHEAAEESVIFTVSDALLQRKLGFYRKANRSE